MGAGLHGAPGAFRDRTSRDRTSVNGAQNTAHTLAITGTAALTDTDSDTGWCQLDAGHGGHEVGGAHTLARTAVATGWLRNRAPRTAVRGTSQLDAGNGSREGGAPGGDRTREAWYHSEIRATNPCPTPHHTTNLHTTDVDATNLHATNVHATNVHATNVDLTRPHLTRPYQTALDPTYTNMSRTTSQTPDQLGQLGQLHLGPHTEHMVHASQPMGIVARGQARASTLPSARANADTHAATLSSRDAYTQQHLDMVANAASTQQRLLALLKGAPPVARANDVASTTPATATKTDSQDDVRTGKSYAHSHLATDSPRRSHTYGDAAPLPPPPRGEQAQAMPAPFGTHRHNHNHSYNYVQNQNQTHNHSHNHNFNPSHSHTDVRDRIHGVGPNPSHSHADVRDRIHGVCMEGTSGGMGVMRAGNHGHVPEHQHEQGVPVRRVPYGALAESGSHGYGAHSQPMPHSHQHQHGLLQPDHRQSVYPSENTDSQLVVEL